MSAPVARLPEGIAASKHSLAIRSFWNASESSSMNSR